MKKIILLCLTLVIFSSAPRVASAHAVVYMCAPRIGANLAKPPSEIVCIFDGALTASQVTLTVVGSNGERVDQNDAQPFQGDAYSYVVSLDTRKMGDGLYQVNWLVQDKSDNTTTSGSFPFGVNTIVPPTPTVFLPGQVMITPSVAAPVNSGNGASELVSRFFIGAGVVILAAMGFLYWRMRQSNEDAARD